jgi:hypothetical protein
MNFQAIKDTLKTNFTRFKMYILSHDAKVELALSPLLFHWIFYLSFAHDDLKLRKASLLSLLMSIGFFAGIMLCVFISLLPYLGIFLANLLHLSLITAYVGYSVFLIYSYRKFKTLEGSALDKFSQKVESYLF